MATETDNTSVDDTGDNNESIDATNESIDNSNEEEQVINPLDVPDKDFDKFITDNLNKLEDFPDEPSDDADTTIVDNDGVPGDSETSEEDTTNSKEEVNSEEDDANDPFNKDTSDTNKDKAKDTYKNEDDKVNDDLESDNNSDKSNINYKAEYEKLLTPFRANNREIHIKDINQARKLMQMGANYNKKMEGLKPSLKILKMLENNDLLDESKLSYLIDLDKKDPDAITKLVKESGIAPLDIDIEKKDEYKPSTYTVNDKEVNLDQALKDIKDSPVFEETINIISNKWDESSRKVLVDNPDLIKVMNEHVEAGVFSKVEQAVEQQRMLGNLQGVSDVEAYQQIGRQMRDNGDFDPTPKSKPTVKDIDVTKEKDDSKRKSRRKAAGSTKTVVGKTKTNQDFNPLAMSDEEFSKLSPDKFY